MQCQSCEKLRQRLETVKSTIWDAHQQGKVPTDLAEWIDEIIGNWHIAQTPDTPDIAAQKDGMRCCERCEEVQPCVPKDCTAWKNEMAKLESGMPDHLKPAKEEDAPEGWTICDTCHGEKYYGSDGSACHCVKVGPHPGFMRIPEFLCLVCGARYNVSGPCPKCGVNPDAHKITSNSSGPMDPQDKECPHHNSHCDAETGQLECIDCGFVLNTKLQDHPDRPES